MRWWVRLAVLVLVGAGARAHAGTHPCGAVRLDGPGGPMERVPVRNQGDVYTCYAHAAAQMVDAWRFSRGGDANYDHLTSAIDVAVGYKVATQDAVSLDWGHACVAYNYVRRNGSCDDRVVPGIFKLRKLDRKVERLKAHYDLYRMHKGVEPTVRLIVEMLQDYLRDGLKIPPTRLPTRAELRAALDQPTKVKFLKAIMTADCTEEHRVRPVLPKCVSDDDAETAEEHLRTLHDQMDEPDPQPAAIAFCSNVLKKGRKAGTNVEKGEAIAGCSRHAALVIGRRMEKGSCQFLVRNSWGTRSKKHSKDWQDEGGNVWVDADLLSRNTYRVSYLQEPGDAP